MVIRKHAMCRLSLLCLALLPIVRAASAVDVTVYLVKKGLEYVQTDENAPAVNTTNGYGFAAEVDLSSNGSVTNASIQPPAGLPVQSLVLSASQNRWDFKKKYSSLTSLNSHYPDGGYTFQIFGRNDGLRQPALQLVGSTYPSGPHLHDFAALQTANPNGYLLLGWDGFAGGTAADYIQLRVEDLSGNKLFETPDLGPPGALDGAAVHVLLAPGMLPAGQTNRLTLTFQKAVSPDQGSYPGALGEPAYYARTTLGLITTRAVTPDVQTFKLFKGREWIQTGTNMLVPQAGSEFVFDASVQSYYTGMLSSGTLLFPPANSLRNLVLQPDGITLLFTNAATTQAGLDSACAAGTYTFVFNASHNGSKSLPLDLPVDAFPPAPRIANFDALQVINVAQPLIVTWDPWAGGGSADFAQMRVEDANKNKVFETPNLGRAGALDGRATSAVIPAGTLPVGQFFDIYVTFLHPAQINTAAYPGVLGISGFQARTTMTIQTFLVPVISSDASRRFGSTIIGETSQQTLTLSNLGNATLNVSSISYPEGFSGDWSGSIPVQGFQTVPVTFAPSAQRPFQGAAVINSDASRGTSNVWLYGTGYYPVTNTWALWWESTDSSLALWQVTGTNATFISRLSPPVAGPGWHVFGTSDLNNDGQQDLLFQHTDGRMAAWLMNGTNRQNAVYLTPLQVDPSWKAMATGDLFGTGHKDILWERLDGALAVWRMNGAVATQSLRLNPGSVNPSWRLAGCADFNGDTKADILWQNSDGRLAVWLMDGTNRTASVYLNPSQVQPSWKVVATTEFNGDGRPGLIWQHDTGVLAYWQVDGTNCVHAGRVTPTAGLAWRVVGPR